MSDKEGESAKLYTKYVSYNGEADSPAASAESADGCFSVSYDQQEEDGSGKRAKNGLSMGLGAIFLISEMAGAGLLNLPRALADTWWFGLPLMAVLCGAVGFAGTRLALCWVLLEERWPEYRGPCRRPYPAIALRALGKPGQIVAEIGMVATLFGAATVYLLLSSEMAHGLLLHRLPSVSHCAWSLLIGLVLTPATWLGSPKDFKIAPVLALMATLVVCLVVLAEVIAEKDDHDPPTFPKPSVYSFFLGFGSILFSLGGSSIFPTIQNDMKDRSDFPHSIVVTFLVLFGLYASFSTICYGVLGDAGVRDDILQSVTGRAVTVTDAFLLAHFLLAFVIVANPVDQALEGLLGLPNRLCARRCALRTAVTAAITATALAVPDFGKVVDLVGGSTVTVMSFVLPPLCYLRLSASPRHDGLPHREVPLWEKVLLYAIILIGVVGGVASTWSALKAILAPESISTTCFSSATFFS